MRAPSTTGIWILLGVLWFATLPLRPLFDPDEGRYAEIPREMVANGDWVTPTLNELKYFEKPPLQYWATAALYSVVGLHDWSSRLWAAALAFLCIPLVFVFATRIGYPRDTSLIAAALLATNPYFAITGQLSLLDQGFAFFLTAAVFGFALSQRAEPRSRAERNWMLVTWVALALAVLTKGIVTGVLAGGTLTLYMLWTRDASPLRRMHFLVGLPLFCVIVLPWFWLVQSRNPEFAQFFFIHEHFARYLTNVANREEPWWYFFVIVLFALLPLIWNVRNWKLPAAGEPGQFQVEKFLLLWCAVVFGLFSASHSKLATYVLPLMPALAVLLARSTAAQPSALRRARIALVVLVVVAASGVTIGGAQRSGELTAESMAWALIAAAVCAIYLVHARLRREMAAPQGWLALAAFSIAAFQALFMCYAASYPARGGMHLAETVAPHISPTTPLYFVGHYRQTLNWYLRREIPVYDYTGELEFGMQQSHRTEPRDTAAFLKHWQMQRDAVAFVDVRQYDALMAAGMSGRVIAQDRRSIVIQK